MKVKIKKLINQRFIRKLYKILKNRINYPKNDYFCKISKYKNLELWDPKLEESISPYYIDLSGNGTLYGHSKTIKDFLGLHPKHIFYDVHIQHGVYLESFEASVLDKYVKKIVVMSDFMANNINSNLTLKEQQTKKTIVVGPIINYAKKIYPEKRFNKIKFDLGKTLVVFLPHARFTNGEFVYLNNLIYTPDRVHQSLKRYNKSYDTIIICNHVDSSSNEKRNDFIRLGYKYVVAGSPNDMNFLSRQRTIMELADHSVSYSISTHVGYFVSLGISHEIINLDNNKTFDKTNQNPYLTYKVPKKNLSMNYLNILSELEFDLLEPEQKLLEVFYKSGTRISKKQREIIEIYWGSLIPKGIDELKELI